MLRLDTDKQYHEAIVLSVDIRRGVCKCKTIKGHYMNNVIWAREIGQVKETGKNSAPLPGENVYICMIEGQPIIVFSKGLISTNSTKPTRLSDGSADSSFEQGYNLSVMGKAVRSGGSTPEDQVPGDMTFTNDRGGVIGLLRSGSAIIKASPLAQIFLSKFDDIVRIVARNYEQFSDAVLRVQVNVKGKIYQYTAYFRDQDSSLNETPSYYEIVGDVEAGEQSKDNYLNVEPSASGDTVKKQVVPDHYEHTLRTNGNSYRKVYSGGDTCIEQMSSSEWKITVGSSIVTVTSGQVKIETPKLVVESQGMDVTVTGDYSETVIGTKTVTVLGSVTETSTGAWTIAGNPTVIP